MTVDTDSWIGVDLDGTLAVYHGWDGGKIGPPVPRMLERVKRWLGEGRDVRIFTARVSETNRGAADVREQIRLIQNWCLEYVGRILPITCSKDFAMEQLWDDRCVQVETNTGREQYEICG